MGTHKRNALLPPLLFYYLVVAAVGRVVRFDWVLCDTGRDYGGVYCSNKPREQASAWMRTPSRW